MNTHLLALQLMAAQGLLGAFDTVYHHELTEALPQRSTARLELSIHSVRAVIYSALFIGLSSWEWHGTWTLVLFSLFAVEIGLTLWDFVTEDKTRLLPATERITHTILAINGGAFITLLAIDAQEWYAHPAGLVFQSHGLLSVFLALCGLGVGLSGIRDGLAAFRLRKTEEENKDVQPIHFSNRPEHVLVTGATGFVGQLLVRELIKGGHQVTVLVRQPKKAAWIFDGQVRCIRSMAELPSSYPIDLIINLAGARILGWRWTSARKATLRQSRVALTEELVRWIARAEKKPRLLLSASAIGYYGTQRQGDDTQLMEESPPQDIFMSKLCQEWEATAKGAVRYGTSVICMRFGLVLGHQGALPMMLLPIKLGLGGPLGSGKQWLSWIHVHDLLRGIAHLIQQHDQENFSLPAAAAYNFTAPESVTQQQFSQIAATIHQRPCFMSTPALPMRMALGEQADLLLEGQCVAPSKLLEDGFTFRYPTMQNALAALA